MTHHQHIEIAEKIVDMLENKFKIGPFKFGLDPLLGLIPILGDLIPDILAGYLVWVAWRANLSKKVIGQMVGLVVVDFAISSVPIAGDIADFFFRAYSRNLMILKRELATLEKQSAL